MIYQNKVDILFPLPEAKETCQELLSEGQSIKESKMGMGCFEAVRKRWGPRTTTFLITFSIFLVIFLTFLILALNYGKVENCTEPHNNVEK